MRVATFNILHGQPVSGPASLAAANSADPYRAGSSDGAELVAAITELDSDVIGLQEVDVDQPRSGHVDQPRLVADALGASWRQFVPTVIGTPGGSRGFRSSDIEERAEAVDGASSDARYGIALVSKLPVVQWHTEVFAPARVSLPLMVQTEGKPRLVRVRDEQRAVIAATIEGAHGQITVATAHLSFVPGFNVSQLRRVRSWLTGLPRPLVLMGDFNLPWPMPIRITKWEPLAHAPTFPSYKPRVQLDHILVDGAPADVVERARKSAQALRLPVSDHCALRAEIDI